MVKIRVLMKDDLPKEGSEAVQKNIIIHIHGGGFVGLSSMSHQNYIRKWAVSMPDSVVFSIDYRLAPQFTYPTAIDDIWQAYYWILTQCKQQLSIFD